MGISFKLSKTVVRSATGEYDEAPAPGESTPALSGGGSMLAAIESGWLPGDKFPPPQHTPVESPTVVGSPLAMVMQQQISPQKIAQNSAMGPQQLSSGAMQQMNNGGNPGAGPASPQLSSLTHGPVGSFTSSPMEQLQGADKVGPSSNKV